ncbi:hypothetical protein V499_05161 [Pseudogymnoascus sp. VKM F-103]|nr:hypothetical protein V499_05161 [Pseudogymnoascus sp. VKM F-103]
MPVLVVGFPSQVGALQFEWAWQHPTLSTHLSPPSTTSSTTQPTTTTTAPPRPRARRPRLTLPSSLKSLHHLLSSPSFSRWPLRLHFQSEEVYAAWLKASGSASSGANGLGGGGEGRGREVEVVKDFDSAIFQELGKVSKVGKGGKAKAKEQQDEVEEVEKEVLGLGNCAACGQGGGIMAVCGDEECGVATHITCLAKHGLRDEAGKSGKGQILPLSSKCPRCRGEMGWSDVAGGVTGRIRGKGAKGVGGAVASAGVVGSADVVENGSGSASGSGVESGSESEADSWAGVVEL